jgi:hypothetical protein
MMATVPKSAKCIDVMLSKAKHLGFSRSYQDEILRPAAQNDIATQSL